MFVSAGSSKRVSLLFERASNDIGILYYEPPELIRIAAGTLLYLHIVVDGTGHFNQSESYIRSKGKWELFDATSWLKDLTSRIPKGLEIWKGVWPDLKTMTADVYLYRSGDGNCCPSGGVAKAKLALQSRRLVLRSVEIKPIE